MISKICFFAGIFGLALTAPTNVQLPVTKFTHIHTIQTENDDSRTTIKAKIVVKDQLMSEAIKKSQQQVSKAQKLVQDFCNTFFKNLDCENIFQVAEINYEAQYEDQKRSLDFINFWVQNNVQFTVENDKETVASLIDKLNEFGISKIQQVTQAENDDEDWLGKAIEQGQEKCSQLCKKMGGRIKDVDIIEQQQQEDDSKVSVKFEVECQILPAPEIKPKPKKKK